MMPTRAVTVVCNPTARGGRSARALGAVQATLLGHGLDVDVVCSRSPEHAGELALAAAADGREVAAFGGDGMVRLIAHALRGSDTVLSVLPGGRGNDFAAVLGIPRDPVAACSVIADGEVRALDVGDADGHTFLGIASIGLESEVTRRANAAPRIGGDAVYAWATLAGLAHWRPARLDVTVEGETRSFTGYLAGAANSGRFGGGMRLAPDASLDDGLLDVVVIEDHPKLRFLLNAPKVFKGTHVGDPNVHVLRARSVTLDADRPLDVYADGEVISATPSSITVVPGALRMRCPRPADVATPARSSRIGKNEGTDQPTA